MSVDVGPLCARSESAPLPFITMLWVERAECHYLSVLQGVITKTEITIQA